MNRKSNRSNSLREKYGPWAVVTGASSGIGRETAIQLAEAGIHLVLVARRKEVLADLAEKLESANEIEVRPLELDLTSDTAMTGLAAATQSLEVGLFVAAAGFGTSGRFTASPIERELDMISLNCLAVVEQAHHFGRRFASEGRGGLILFGSIVGFQGTPMAAHYAATKAYVQSLAEALHLELSPLGVDVLASAPGPTHTEFADHAGMKMGKALHPSEVAKETLAALGSKATVLPGSLTKFLTWSLAMLPRWARVRVMGNVMKGMVESHARDAGTPSSHELVEPA